MRIVCQQCSAAYAIDDKLVTARGVRAQCPRCRHLQHVKLEPSAASPLPPAPPPPPASTGAPVPPAPSPFLFDLAGPPPPSSSSRPPGPAVSKPGTPAPFAFDFGAPPPPSGARAPVPTSAPSGGFDFSSLPPPPPPAPAAAGNFDFGGLQPPVPPQRAASAPSLPTVPPPPPPASATSSANFGAGFTFGGRSSPTPAPTAGERFGAPAAPAEEQTGVRCHTCGKVMTDAFDQALGTCDDCRNKAQEVPPGPDTGAGRVEHVLASEIHSRLEQAQEGYVPPAPPPPPPRSAPTPAPIPKSVKSALRNPDADPDGPGRGRLALAALALFALVAAGTWLVVRRPWARRTPVLVTRPTPEQKRPVEGIIQQWRLNYPELEGAASKQAKAHLEEGEALLKKDTTGAYLDAEEEFQKALVLDPSLDRAVAGWVLSIAFGHGAQIDDQTARAAESMLTSAEGRGAEPRTFVAHAHLLIARGGNPNDIKMLAERGRASADASDRSLAALALGQTFLTKNPQLADENFKESLKLDPQLKRGYFFQALLATSQGRYKDAVGSLEKRLELDPDQWEAAEELARLYVDVGEVAKARKVLEAARAASPNAGRPRLDLAMIDYQHLGEPARAQEALSALVNDASIPRTERADAWVHLAVIARLGGDLTRATAAVDKALEISSNSLPARLQKFLTLVERHIASSARLEFDALKGRLNDPQLEAALEGRLMLEENRLDDAVKTLTGAFQADPRRVDALLLAGAAAARSRKDGKAWELCLKQGLKADPRGYPVPPLTHLYVRPADLLKGAAGAYDALSSNRDEDPNPSLCEGLVAWFSEDPAGADKRFARVNAIDPRNADAYAYRALIALGRKDPGTAARLTGRGLDSSRSNALVYVAQGMLAAATNKPDEERTAGHAAAKLNPSLLSARTLIGEADARLKQADEARRGLTTVLLTDPLFRDAKRVLYKQQL